MVPEAKIVPVKRDRKICGETVAIQPLLVDPDTKGIQYVVLSLEGIDHESPEVPEDTVLFANQDCAFHPRVKGAVVGQRLELVNKDPMLHNTHLRLGKRTFVNVAQVIGGRPILKKLQDAGIMRITCDKHKFMEGFLLTFDHPYFAVTNALGEFAIRNVPPGRWKLTIWHQTLGALETQVTVSPAKDTILDMAYPDQ
jgi:plastocyanin